MTQCYVTQSSEALNELYDSDRLGHTQPKARVITRGQMQKISTHKNPSGWLAVFEQPSPESLTNAQWVVALDGIQDPGNMGTILRLCDWFGMTHLVCSLDTVEQFNPKVVQASMGSILRVAVHYVPMDSWLASQSKPIFGAVLQGTPVTKAQWPEQGILLMGNEGQGIRPNHEQFITEGVTITGSDQKGAESLNVAMATGILLHQWHLCQ